MCDMEEGTIRPGERGDLAAAGCRVQRANDGAVHGGGFVEFGLGLGHESRAAEPWLAVFALGGHVDVRVLAVPAEVDRVLVPGGFDEAEILSELGELVQVGMFEMDVSGAGELDFGGIVGNGRDPHVGHDGFA